MYMQQVKQLIREALLIFGADKTGKVDYALESSGKDNMLFVYFIFQVHLKVKTILRSTFAHVYFYRNIIP